MKKGHIPPAHRERKARWAPLVMLLVVLLGGHMIAPPPATSWMEGTLPEHTIRSLVSHDESNTHSSPGNSSGDQQPSLWNRTWQKLQQNPIIAKIVNIASWISDGLRVLWAIPKAIVRGDSRALIEAIGQLLSRASPAPSADPKSTNSAVGSPATSSMGASDSREDSPTNNEIPDFTEPATK